MLKGVIISISLVIFCIFSLPYLLGIKSILTSLGFCPTREIDKVLAHLGYLPIAIGALHWTDNNLGTLVQKHKKLFLSIFFLICAWLASLLIAKATFMVY